MQLTDKAKGYLMVGASGFFWGTGFLYIQYILDSGLAPKDMVSWKMIVGFIFMFAYTYFKDKKLLKIDKKTLIYIAIMAFVCHVLYNLFMNIAIERTTIATTVALLYTAPIFVLIISRLVFKELFTTYKIIAVVVCITGVFLTVTGGTFEVLDFNVSGVIFGLAAGLAYAMMNLISKALVSNYKQVTILTYTFGLAFLFSLTFSNPLAAFKLEFNIWFWVNILLLGFIPTVLGYFCFTTGLSYGIESSKAAIIATIEVPVSVVGSYLIFAEYISAWKLIGIILVLLSVFLIHKDDMKAKEVKGLTDSGDN